MVIRTSQLIPEMQEAFFQCQVCAFSTRVEVDRGRIAEPAVCRNCNNAHSLALIHNRSLFSDKQMVSQAGRRGADSTPRTAEVTASAPLSVSVHDRSKSRSLQRTCRRVRRRTPPSSTPTTTWWIRCSRETASTSQASVGRPGPLWLSQKRRRLHDASQMSPAGIYRAVPMRVSPIQSNVKSVYKTHIDAIHFRKTDEKRLHGLDEEAEQKLFTEDRVQVLKELAAKPDVYERLSSALAPSIYEHEDIKKVRGSPRAPAVGHAHAVSVTFPLSPSGDFTAAVWGLSERLQPDRPRPLPRRGQHPAVRRPRDQQVPAAAVRLQPGAARAVHVRQRFQRRGSDRLRDEGPGDPAAGAADGSAGAQRQRHLLHRRVRQDERQHALGAARGHGAADALHRQGWPDSGLWRRTGPEPAATPDPLCCVRPQAGIICQLNARTAVLAAANPVESQWNPKKTTIENIQLPHTLLSR